jgi:hypothetical protein
VPCKYKFSMSCNYKYIMPWRYKSTMLLKHKYLVSCVYKYILWLQLAVNRKCGVSRALSGPEPRGARTASMSYGVTFSPRGTGLIERPDAYP